MAEGYTVISILMSLVFGFGIWFFVAFIIYNTTDKSFAVSLILATFCLGAFACLMMLKAVFTHGVDKIIEAYSNSGMSKFQLFYTLLYSFAYPIIGLLFYSFTNRLMLFISSLTNLLPYICFLLFFIVSKEEVAITGPFLIISFIHLLILITAYIIAWRELRPRRNTYYEEKPNISFQARGSNSDSEAVDKVIF